VGWSAVLFGLKTIQTFGQPGHAQVGGFTVPMRLVSWAELVYISLLNPQASWLGHGAGILAGLVELKIVPAGRRLLR
jgi:rhomboid domain-containing protein 1